MTPGRSVVGMQARPGSGVFRRTNWRVSGMRGAGRRPTSQASREPRVPSPGFRS